MPERLQNWVEQQAARRPDAPAVVSGASTLTYGRLDTLSTQLARILREGGCRRGDRICLLMPKGPEAIVSILGIYKADCVYVPLDPASPPERLTKLLHSCESGWILSAGSPPASLAMVRLLDEVFGDERLRSSVRVGWMASSPPTGEKFKAEFSAEDLRSQPDQPVKSENTRDDPAHILFTSGSTGSPKGVVITHSNVIRFVEWAVPYFGMNASDRVSGHPPLHFDLSFLDIFGAFASGAQLHLVPPEMNVLPNKLAEFIRNSELTQWFSVPSVLAYMAKFDAVKFKDFPALKRVLWCGEVFPTPSLIYWMKRLPHAAFTNLYGPTEATIASSYYTVPKCPEDEKAEIPIGTACEGEELLVLDSNLQPVAPGQVGDLYIRGVGLSPGYFRDPEKTNAAFLHRPPGSDPPDPPDPVDRIYKTGDLARVGPDGLVYFVGRADSQIKSRGYRIELGEIETALNAIARLRECAVVAVQTDGFEGTVVGCAYVPAPGDEVNPRTLRAELGRSLPPYMLPARWMRFERLPKNANGKIDRRTLKEAFERDAAQTA